MKNDLFTPLCVAAVLFDWNHAEIFERAGVVVRSTGLFQILVTPSKISLVSQEVALNPALFGTGFVAVLDKGAFPDAPENARETAASVAVGKAGARDDETVWVGPFPTLDSLCDQSLACAAASEQPSHFILS